MEWWPFFALLLGGFLALIAIGLPVAFSFFFVNVIGSYLFMGGTAGISQMTLDAYSALSGFTLTPIPLFVLMGELMFRSGLAFQTVRAIDGALGKVPGRLSIVAVAASTLFSSFTGSTVSNTALLGSTLLPEMRSKGYSTAMSVGPIIGSGGLAMLIPPSALAVLLGSMARISIGDILVAGVIPAIIMACLYTLYIVTRCAVNPSLAPRYEVRRLRSGELVKEFLLYVCPLFSVALLVLGPIYTGIATPTEAAGLGCVGAGALAALYRRLSWKVLRESLRATAGITSMIFIIIAGSVVYGQIIAFTGAGAGLVDFVASLGLPQGILVVMMLSVLLFLGLFMDQIAMMMITIPVFMPVVHRVGIDPLWFGVMVLIALDVGFTSPPFGLLLFIMKGIVPPDIGMTDIYKAGIPFILCNVLTIAIVFIVPKIVLYVPAMLR